MSKFNVGAGAPPAFNVGAGAPPAFNVGAGAPPAFTDPGVLGGQYFGPQGILEQRGCPKVVTSSEQSYDIGTQQRLWTVSEELTKVVFPVG